VPYLRATRAQHIGDLTSVFGSSHVLAVEHTTEGVTFDAIACATGARERLLATPRDGVTLQQATLVRPTLMIAFEASALHAYAANGSHYSWPVRFCTSMVGSCVHRAFGDSVLYVTDDAPRVCVVQFDLRRFDETGDALAVRIHGVSRYSLDSKFRCKARANAHEIAVELPWSPRVSIDSPNLIVDLATGGTARVAEFADVLHDVLLLRDGNIVRVGSRPGTETTARAGAGARAGAALGSRAHVGRK
jgi:hypothetical protein